MLYCITRLNQLYNLLIVIDFISIFTAIVCTAVLLNDSFTEKEKKIKQTFKKVQKYTIFISIILTLLSILTPNITIMKTIINNNYKQGLLDMALTMGYDNITWCWHCQRYVPVHTINSHCSICGAPFNSPKNRINHE